MAAIELFEAPPSFDVALPRTALPVTPEEGRKLQQITHTSKQPVRVRRAIVVLASAQGQPVPLICRLMQVSENYVRQVIRDFNDEGFAALDPNGAGAGRVRPIRRRVSGPARSRH